MNKKHKVTIELDDELYKAIWYSTLVSENTCANELWKTVQKALVEQRNIEAVEYDVDAKEYFIKADLIATLDMTPNYSSRGEKFYKCNIKHYNPDTYEFKNAKLYIPEGYMFVNREQK